MHVFNYWKDILCVNSIEGFIYYQTFETRVRLFAGYYWASWSGIIGGCYIMLKEQTISHDIGFPLFLISLVLIITFGSNFRRVRRQEARALLLIYSAYMQKKNEKTNKANQHGRIFRHRCLICASYLRRYPCSK